MDKIRAYERALEGVWNLMLVNEMEAGDKLPSERVLCELLEVSRTALRGALKQLTSSGVLVQMQGSGTYVNPNRVLHMFQKSHNFSSSSEVLGLTPSSSLISISTLVVSEKLAARANFRVGSKAFRLERVRRINDIPALIERAYISLDTFPGIDQKYDWNQESLYRVINEEYGIFIKHGKERISLSKSNREESKLLNIEEGTPVIFQRAIAQTDDLITVEFVESVIVPQFYHFASASGFPLHRKELIESWMRL